MKLKIFLFISGILLILSCSDDPTKVSTKNMIERETFVNVLVDIHIMDAISNESMYFRHFAPQDSVDFYSSIFQKYNITKAEFDSTVVAYTRQPGLFKEVYDDVLLKLNVMLDEAKEIEPKFEKEDPLKKMKSR